MSLRTIGFMTSVALGLLAGPQLTEAAELEKVYRIGYLFPERVAKDKGLLLAFQQGLKELGYVEGKNIHPGGLLGSFGILTYRKRIIDFAARSRLPAIYYNGSWVPAGGLMSYASSWPDLFRRAAVYVDKILKGAKPAELPVEQSTKFELHINLKTAKKIGLNIPSSILYQADKVIR